MKKLAHLLLVAMVLAPSVAWAAPTLNNGHVAPVVGIHSTGTTLLSIDADGILKFRRESDGKLLAEATLGLENITQTVFSPDGYTLAALGARDGSPVIVSYNTRLRKANFSRVYNTKPISFGFSSKGTYLLATTAQWNSLDAVLARSGREVTLVGRGFGLVADFFFSSSENTLLSITTTGELSYWNLRAKEETASFPTLENLQYGAFSKNGRYYLARHGADLSLIDLYDGDEIDSRRIENITSICFDETREVFLVESLGSRGAQLSLWRIDSGHLSSAGRAPVPAAERPTSYQMNDGELYQGTENGDIYIQDVPGGTNTLFAENRLVNPKGLAVLDGILYIATDTELLGIAVDDYLSGSRTGEPANLTRSNHGMKDASGLVVWDGVITVWSERYATIYQFDPTTGLENKVDSGLPGFRRIVAGGPQGRAVAVDANDRIYVLENTPLRVAFSYQGKDVRDVVPLPDGNVIASRARVNGSPLLWLNPRTGETLPIESEEFVITDLAFMNGTLYSLGLERSGDQINTVVDSFTGDLYSRNRTLYTLPDEDYEAQLFPVPSSETMYADLGSDTIHFWARGRHGEIQAPGAERLAVSDEWLFSVNRNGSISLWNRATRQKTLDFYLFKNGEWLAILEDGKYVLSQGATDLVLR